MDQTNKGGFGALKQNESTNPRAPGLKGYIIVNDVLYDASGWWVTSGKPGSKYDGVPHWQMKLELPIKRDDHVGGTDYPKYPSRPARPAPVMPAANLGPVPTITDDTIPF